MKMAWLPTVIPLISPVCGVTWAHPICESFLKPDVSLPFATAVIVAQLRNQEPTSIRLPFTEGESPPPLFHVQGEFFICWLENVYMEDLPILHVDDVDDPHQFQRVLATVRSHV